MRKVEEILSKEELTSLKNNNPEIFDRSIYAINDFLSEEKIELADELLSLLIKEVMENYDPRVSIYADKGRKTMEETVRLSYKNIMDEISYVDDNNYNDYANSNNAFADRADSVDGYYK